MIRGLKWLATLWAIRSDPRVARAFEVMRTLSWEQRASLVIGVVRDPRIPQRARLAPLLLAAYVVSPLDLLPDVLPVIGALDDVALMSLVLRFMERSVPAGLLEEHLERVTGVASP